MANQDARRVLNHLYKLCKAGERGFQVVAENVDGRGLKFLLKTHAVQRRQFAEALQAEIVRLGGQVSDRRIWRGTIHRGRINIMATLVIGRENVESLVLKEVAVGERAISWAYKTALNKNLPEETLALLRQQYEAIEAIRTQIAQLRGQSGERVLVRYVEAERVAQTPEAVQTMPVAVLADEKNGSTYGETVVSGALGGAIWGSLLAALSGIGLLIIPGLEPIGAPTIQGTWALITLCGSSAGAMCGAVLGLVIGLGVHEADAHTRERHAHDSGQVVMVQPSMSLSSSNATS
ncbi:MAG: PA2169 family four-helix-bundle protein [Anaerolineales bacterium]|nr:PA2169 family four-helix-bundle protein [Anaerolineales bacterium]